eukprot:scaffold6788_cov71-Cyclotella_meneghiniana.AAC.7
MNLIHRIASSYRQGSPKVSGSDRSRQQNSGSMESKYDLPSERIPPLPFVDEDMGFEDERGTIMPPPLVKRTSEFKLPAHEPPPGTPSTAATTCTPDWMNTVKKAEKTNMEVTITVLSLDGLIAKKDDPKEKSKVLQELSTLSSHGLSLSKHGLSRLSSHGSSVREMLSRHSSHSAKDKNSSTGDSLSRNSFHGSTKEAKKNASMSPSSHGSQEKHNMIDASMSLSCNDKRSTEDVSSSDSSVSIPEVASLVASFSHSVSKKDVLLTHLPSQPMELATETTLQPIAYWSAKVDLDNADQALSTLKFKRSFELNHKSKSKFVPQKCPIKLSVSRKGKMIAIGTADVIIQGTEDGERAITSPVTSRLKTNKSVLPLRKASFPMWRAKGDDMSFGLRPDTKLRVLIHVNEPYAEPNNGPNNMISPRSVVQEESQHNFPIKEVLHHSGEDTLESTENKTDSNCTIDDDSCDGNSTEEEVWEEYVLEDSELRQLRNQLVKSENTNKILQQEIVESRNALRHEKGKYDQFCSELVEMKKNADDKIKSLGEELHIANVQTEATSNSQQNQPKADKWLAATMREELSGLKNVFMRNARKQNVMDDDAAVTKSVTWNDEDDYKNDDEKNECEEELKVEIDEHIGELELIEDVMSNEDPNDVSDEEA